MSAERNRAGEGFLARWSRMKNTAPAEQPVVSRDADGAVPAVDAESEAPPLPPVEELTIDSDFRGFLHPKVDDNVRRAALRKLFSDPHFNVMDGLDVYIDDYSKADPIPPEMLASLMQAQRIFKWSEEKEDEPAHVSDEAQSKALAVDANEAAPPHEEVEVTTGSEETSGARSSNQV